MGGVISRDLGAAAATTHDLIVIGGGIYGVAITHRATRLGLRPLLLERDDFGGATSWNSLRILHGGIRSLQTLDLGCFRDMYVAQSWFLRHFPEHVGKLECLMPLYGRGVRRPAAFLAALALDRLIRHWAGSGRRSTDLPSGKVLDVRETTRRFPLVPREALQGGGVWYDAVMRQPQRILIDWLRWACAGGATALNRVAAQHLLLHRGRVAGIVARDTVAGTSLLFRAPIVINCAGPWSEELGRAFDPQTPPCFRPTLAFNLLLDRQPLAPCAVAVATPSGSGRTYFIVPWGNHTLAGTYHAAWSGPPQRPTSSPEQIEQMLRELNAAVPGWGLASDSVLRVCSGLLPGIARAADAELESVGTFHDHGRAGGPHGLFTVSGVKFTTAPLLAARILRAAGLRPRGSVAPLPRPAARPMLTAAGFRRMLALTPAKAAGWIRRVVAEESVLSIEDLLRRRTDWGFDPHEERELERLVRPLLTAADAAAEPLTTARTG